MEVVKVELAGVLELRPQSEKRKAGVKGKAGHCPQEGVTGLND